MRLLPESAEKVGVCSQTIQSHPGPSRPELSGGTPHQSSNAPPRRTTMNLPNRLSIVALSLLCLPMLAQTVAPKPAPIAIEPTATPATAPAVIVTPDPAATPASTPPAVTVTPATTVTATPDATPAAAPAADTHAQMEKMQSSMTENVAKNDAADAAMKTHMDAMNAGAKSDMEMKRAIIAQLQTMSEQIQQLNDRVTALSTPPEPPAKPVKAKAAKPAKEAVRPPIKPVLAN